MMATIKAQTTRYAIYSQDISLIFQTDLSHLHWDLEVTSHVMAGEHVQKNPTR